MSKNEDVKVKMAEIDEEVVEKIKRDNILAAVSNERLLRRAELNMMCELLGEVQKATKSIDEISNIFAVCAHDKITEFFAGVRENFEQEKARLAEENAREEQEKTEE